MTGETSNHYVCPHCRNQPCGAPFGSSRCDHCGLEFPDQDTGRYPNGDAANTMPDGDGRYPARYRDIPRTRPVPDIRDVVGDAIRVHAAAIQQRRDEVFRELLGLDRDATDHEIYDAVLALWAEGRKLVHIIDRTDAFRTTETIKIVPMDYADEEG